MGLFYSLAYSVGFTPWEEAARHPAAAGQVAALLDREERERRPPYGRALDLGCGRGHWSLELARRGWQVTGVELVPRAARAARRRASAAAADVTIVEGDMTALTEAGVGSGFRLVWDFGALHGLTPEELRAVGRGVGEVAAEDATALILAWSPGRRAPLPRGLSGEELEAAFAGWRVSDEEPFDATGLPRPLRNVGPRVFRLRRG